MSKLQEVLDEIDAGRTITAIKLLRAKYGLHLREAKDVVETLIEWKFKK